MSKFTMQDIAALAGVSVATVSRAIHTPQFVRSKTRERVLSIIEKHGYVYNAAAGDFSRNKSTVIGLLIPTTEAPLFASTILAIQERANDKGYSILLGNTQYDYQTESNLLQRFEERRLAGVILTGFNIGQENRVKKLADSGVPCFIIWEKPDNPALSYVGLDNYRAAYSMTNYLASLHHTRIGLMIGLYTKVGRVRKRYEGFMACLKDLGLECRPEWIVETVPTLQGGKDSMSRILSLQDRPTAIFAASDVLAIGALAAVRAAGLRVPEDLSLAGFDDIEFAAYCDPPLTTVRVPGYEIGRIAVDMLLEGIERNSTQARHCCLDTEIIVRGSCREHS
ncbi:MAG: LacI family DNA-binding transcriptional regulator [Desulfomonilaceae bacterium]